MGRGAVTQLQGLVEPPRGAVVPWLHVLPSNGAGWPCTRTRNLLGPAIISYLLDLRLLFSTQEPEDPSTVLITYFSDAPNAAMILTMPRWKIQGLGIGGPMTGHWIPLILCFLLVVALLSPLFSWPCCCSLNLPSECSLQCYWVFTSPGRLSSWVLARSSSSLY